MRMLRPLRISGPLMLAILLSACGNKGDLVKPTPPADQQPAAPATPGASDSTPKPGESGTTPAASQDSSGP